MTLVVNPIDYAVLIDRADDQELKITISDAAGAALNVTGASFKLTVKKSLDDDIGAAKFQKTSGTAGHFDLTQAASGIVICNLASGDIAALAGEHVYDVEMTLSGKVRTIIPAAAFFVRKDVSTPGVAPPPGAILIPFSGAIGIDGALYLKDQTTGLYFKGIFENGGLNWYGPNATIPF